MPYANSGSLGRGKFFDEREQLASGTLYNEKKSSTLYQEKQSMKSKFNINYEELVSPDSLVKK